MEQIIYFQDKTLKFSSFAPDATWFVLHPSSEEDLTRAKVLFFLEIHNKVAVITPDPAAAYRRFAADFLALEAAGGVVVNGAGEWLMISRNGRWDLPKGRVEAGEDYACCAAREIEEVVWCNRTMVDKHLENTFPTIRVVVEALRGLIARA